MPNVNPGPGLNQGVNVESVLGTQPASNATTFASLPPANSVAAGTLAYTTDDGYVYSTGVSWQTFGGTMSAVNQGTPNTLANAWPMEITDGTNGPVAVKPANTSAVAADPALVVAISPNNSVSIGGTVTVGGNVTVAQGVSNAVPWNVSVGNFPSTQNVSIVNTASVSQSGNWTILSVTNPVTVAQGTSNAVPWNVSVVSLPSVTGTVTANQGTSNATPWAVSVANFGTQQQLVSIAGAVTIAGGVSITGVASVNITQVGGVTIAAQTKGTQGPSFMPTMDAKDSQDKYP